MQKHFFKLLMIFQLVSVSKTFAQNIALNATGSLPDTSAMLDVSSSNKGFLLPRMAQTQVNAIPLPATGLIIYNTTISAFQVNTGTAASPSWQTLGTTVGNWLTGGNAGTSSASKFIGTTDSVSLRFRTNNTQRLMLDSLGNVAVGSTPSFTASPNADKFLVDAGTTSSYNVITAKGNVNNYLQFNVQNQSPGTSASSDLVATADNGSETANFVDMGVNGSGYTGGVMGSANDAYLFNIGNNLLLGTGTASKSVIFMTGGTLQSTYERMRIDGTGNVGIGNTSPGSKLDVKGILRLTGATSGYVGFAPAAVAGSTTYTLPNADGTNGQVLSTNGSGTLSWATASGGGSGWGLTGNSGTSSSTNYIGTSDNTDVTFKRSGTVAGSLATSGTSFGVSSSASTTQGSAFGASASASGSASVAVGYNSLSTMANSIAIGATSQVQPGSGSTADIAIGYGANVSGGGTGSYSTAIGASAQVQASNGLAIGKSANVNSQYALAIGDGAQAQGTSAVVVGQSAFSNSTNTVSIGASTQTQGAYDISIGYNSYASSQDAIAIGDHAQAQGTNSIAIGTGLYNGSGNTVAIGNSSVTSFLLNGASSGSSKALIVGNSSSNGNGAYLTTGGTWTNSSDRNLKDDLSSVDDEEILNKVSQLDITRWKYKGTGEYHIGPMAQDFYKSFSLGNDDKHISTIDPAGIALVSIKALKQENDELNKKIAAQQLLIEQLQKMMEEIKSKLH